jgi:hypothetical protein
MRAHLHHKQRRMQTKVLEPLPASIVRGEMNEELFRAECELHEAAGLPPPTPLAQQLREQRKTSATSDVDRLVGVVPFAALVAQVQSRKRQRVTTE